MSALTDRALACLEALKGGTFTGGRAVEHAKLFINDDTLTNDQTAQLFLDTLLGIVKSTNKSHAQQAAETANEAGEIQAGDDAVTDL